MRQEEKLRKVHNGDIVSINRSRTEILRMKEDKGGFCSSKWFLKGLTSNTIKCQVTLNGLLAKQLTVILNMDRNPQEERIKVVEEGVIHSEAISSGSVILPVSLRRTKMAHLKDAYMR